MSLLYTQYEEAVYLTGDNDDVLKVYNTVDEFKTSIRILRRIGFIVSKFIGDIIDQNEDSKYYDIFETSLRNMINPVYIDVYMQDNTHIQYNDDNDNYIVDDYVLDNYTDTDSDVLDNYVDTDSDVLDNYTDTDSDVLDNYTDSDNADDADNEDM